MAARAPHERRRAAGRGVPCFEASAPEELATTALTESIGVGMGREAAVAGRAGGGDDDETRGVAGGAAYPEAAAVTAAERVARPARTSGAGGGVEGVLTAGDGGGDDIGLSMVISSSGRRRTLPRRFVISSDRGARRGLSSVAGKRGTGAGFGSVMTGDGVVGAVGRALAFFGTARSWVFSSLARVGAGLLPTRSDVSRIAVRFLKGTTLSSRDLAVILPE